MKDTTLLKIPILDTVFKGLEEAFVGAEQNSHDFVWKEISTILKDERERGINKSCMINIIKNGKQESESVRLKEISLENVSRYPKWIPDNMDSSEIRYLEHKFTETEMKFLTMATSYNVFRHQKFGESLKQENQRILDHMIYKNAKPELIEDAKAESKKTM